MNVANITSKLNITTDQLVRKQENVTKLIRLVKKLGNKLLTACWLNFAFIFFLFTEELSEYVDEKQEKYNALQKINNKIRSNITELEVIIESQQIEKIHLKQSLKNLKKNVKQTEMSNERLKNIDVNNEKFEKQL